MSREFEYKITKKITEEDIENLVVDGFETGICYWAMLHNNTDEFDKYYKTTDLATAEIVAKILLAGGSVKITDNEEDVEPKYDLTLDRLIIGIQKNAEERPWDCDLDNYDADTCDCIIQYAIFDEVVFG